MQHRQKRMGTATILALLLLVLTASLAAAFITSVQKDLLASENLAHVQHARFAAESGLDFLAYKLKELELGSNLSGQALFDDLASSLQGELNGTANLGGGTVTYNPGSIAIPAVAVGDHSSFTATVTMPDANTISLAVTGSRATSSGMTVTRRLSMDFGTGPKAGGLDYGIYSKGPVAIGLNLDYRGANRPDEASIYTEASVAGPEVDIDNNGHIDGDIDVVAALGSVSLGNNCVVGGTITIGAPQSAMPEVDASIFAGFATNVMDASTPRQNVTLTNLRIPANTDPEFGSNVILKGVVYIESPNYVYFKNNVDVTGVIVAEKPAPGGGGTNKIEFKNNLTITGVENLPDTPADRFSEIRQLTGSAILAPGFDLEFKNNFVETSGTIACENLILKNNVASTIKGAIIIYGSGGLTFKNNSIITIDRSNMEGLPAGVTAPGPTVLAPRPDSYTEY